MGRKILVTGATGYIGKHLVRRLLDAGHEVTGSTRDPSRHAEMRAALTPHLSDKAALDNYRTVALDLTSDEGWSDAMRGQDVLMHIASPFPMANPKNADDVIRPAVDGTMRALKAACKAHVENVVMTSSVAAVAYGVRKTVYDERDWTDAGAPLVSTYSISKTLAERAAWEFVLTDGGGMRLAVINPAMTLGAPLDGLFGTSVAVVRRILSGRDPMLPRIRFGICDVQDVVDAHIRAMNVFDAAGHRHIICDRVMWMTEIAQVVKSATPSARISTLTAPNFAVRLIARFDGSARGIVGDLGHDYRLENARMREVLGIEPRPAAESIRETAAFLARLPSGG